jgi:hypothetical protein
LSTGEIISVSFPIYPVCNQFDRGHRIQLLISGSSFPRFDVNPNTGEPIGRQTVKRTARACFLGCAPLPQGSVRNDLSP